MSRDSAFGVTFSRILSALLQMVVTLGLAARLPQADFGVIASTLNALLVAYGLCDFGLEQSAGRERARGGSEALVSAFLRIQRIPILILLLASSIALVLKGGVSALTGGLVLVGLAAAIEKRSSARMTFLIAARRPRALILAVTLVRLPALAGVFYPGPGSPVIAYGVGYAVGAALAYAFLLRASRLGEHGIQAGPPVRITAPVIKAGLPYWTASASGLIRSLDTVLVAALVGPSAAATYALASRIAVGLRLLPSSLAAVAFVESARRPATRADTTRTAVRSAVVTTVPTVLVAAAAPLLPGLLGEEYRGSIAVLHVLLIGVILNGVGSVLSAALQGGGHANAIARLGVILALLQLTLAVPLLYAVGTMGMTYALIVVAVVQLSSVTTLSRRISER